MKSIRIGTRKNEDWSGKFLDQSNYDFLLEESAQVFKPDGELLLALFKGGHSVKATASAWSMIKGFNPTTNNRGLAAGSERRKVRNQNVADPVNSGILGYFERSPRFPFCRPCAWNQQNPEKFSMLFPACVEASRFYAEVGGKKYEKQSAHALNTQSEFMITGTIFSTVTVNKNFRCAAHKDAGNLEGTLNVMSLFREGIFTGGFLVMPDFRIAVKLETGDCIVFDAHEFHGNTPIIQISKKITRCTVVYYYRQNMDLCGTAKEELERAKRRQRGEPMFEHR